MGFPSLLFFQCRVKMRVPLDTTLDSPEAHWQFNIPIKQSASLPGYILSPCGQCTPPGGHFCVGSPFLLRSRSPGNKFPHALITMNHQLQRLAAGQILGQTVMQAFLLSAMLLKFICAEVFGRANEALE